MSDEVDYKKEEKKLLKRQKSLMRIKKAFYVVFILYVFLFVLIYAINKDVESSKEVYQKVGTGSVAQTISMKDALIIKEYTISPFKYLLENKNYESAYGLLSDDYREYCSFDSFVQEFSPIDASSIEMKDIYARSNYALEASVIYKINDKDYETTYMIYQDEHNTEVYKISPNGFLYYVHDQKFKKDGMEINIDSCVVYTDHVDLKGSIANVEWFEDRLSLTQFGISFDKEVNLWQEFNKTITKDGAYKFDIRFENTNFFIPNGIRIERSKANYDRVYWFKFQKDAKK